MSEMVDKKLLFGEKAVKANFITEEELQTCLAYQEKHRRKRPDGVPKLGEIMVHKGIMTKDQVVQILRGKWQPIEGRFGEVAVALELVTEDERDACVKSQNRMRKGGQRRPLPIGQIMVQEGLIRPNAILRILSFQQKTVARCPKCGAAYNIENFQPGLFNCSIDGESLEEVADLEGLESLSEKEATQKSIRPLVEMARGEEFGRFTIERKLGSNPLGDCYVAHQEERKRDVVLRVLDPVRTLETAYKDTLLNGAQTAINLAHGNVRRVYMVGRKRGYYYLAMEYINGHSLRSILKERGSLPYEPTLEMVKKVCDALGYGEMKGLRHGDIRPSNIVLTGKHISLLNLGIPVDAKEMFRAYRDDQEIPGFYIAPEVVLNADVDARADIFSLGCVFYHALAGRPPFRGRSTVEILDKMTKLGLPPLRNNAPLVPSEACDLIERMLSVEAEDRPKSFEQLSRLLETLPVDAKKTGLGEVDFTTVLGDRVGRIGDDDIEKARLHSMKMKRQRRKKKAPEDSMSYSKLIESMRAKGDDDEAAVARETERAGTRRVTLQELSKKKAPEPKGAAIHGSSGISRKPFYTLVLFLLVGAIGSGAFLVLRVRARSNASRAAIEAAQRDEEAQRDAYRDKVGEAVNVQEAMRRRQAFELQVAILRQLQSPAFNGSSLAAMEARIQQVGPMLGPADQADLEMALGRGYLYRLVSDEFRFADSATQESWIQSAREHLEAARTGYESGTTMISSKHEPPPLLDQVPGQGPVVRKAPVMDLRLRLPDWAPEHDLYLGSGLAFYDEEDGAIDYQGNSSLARQDMEKLLGRVEEIAAGR